MSFVTRNLHQTATRYAASGNDGFGGSSWTKSTINCRWEDKSELFVNESGEEVRSEAMVYLEDDVNNGDWLVLGNSTASDPTTLSSAYEVREFRKTPTVKADAFERLAIL